MIRGTDKEHICILADGSAVEWAKIQTGRWLSGNYSVSQQGHKYRLFRDWHPIEGDAIMGLYDSAAKAMIAGSKLIAGGAA